jgi:hypothetical protein
MRFRLAAAWPTWSPDDRRIAYVSTDPAEPGIFVANADGSGARKLTDGDLAQWCPVAAAGEPARPPAEGATAVDTSPRLYPIRVPWYVHRLGSRGTRVYLYGYMDRQKRIVVPPKFAEARDFHEGLACVDVRLARPGPRGSLARKRLYGYIDATGEMAITPAYPGARDFSSGVARVGVGRGNLCAAIDKTGQTVVDCVETDFGNGIAMRRNKAGDAEFVSTTGKVLFVRRMYNAYGPFREGLAWARHMGHVAALSASLGSPPQPLHGYINTRGDFALPLNPDWHNVGDFREGLAPVSPVSERVPGAKGSPYPWGFMDRRGRMVIPAKFLEVRGFSEGLAAVRAAGPRWGYINRTGALIIPERYDEAGEFHGGWARVVQGTTWVYIDSSGNTVWTEADVPTSALALPPVSEGMGVVAPAHPPAGPEPERTKGPGEFRVLPVPEYAHVLLYRDTDLKNFEGVEDFARLRKPKWFARKYAENGECVFKNVTPPFVVVVEWGGHEPHIVRITDLSKPYACELRRKP